MTEPVAAFDNAGLAFKGRPLWEGLNFHIHPGEYIAVLGGNGTGKTSLLRVLLGLQPLTSGTVTVSGRPVRRGCADIGYVPQQRAFDERTPLRGRDLVGLGLDGHRWGPRIWGRRAHRQKVDALLERVGALGYADSPLGLLSGGEQQRLRVAQALAMDPTLLLFDEALLSLDLHRQSQLAQLVQQQRERTGAAVLFVTHDVNPIIHDVDRVLYLANGSFRVGTPEEVLRSDVLSQLYGAPVEVIDVAGRVVVVGAEVVDHCHPPRTPQEVIR